MGKKDRCAVFGCNNDILVITFFSINIQRSSLFARKARVNTERVPPGHPIILLKSNNFNMAAVQVKRSIRTTYSDSVAMILSDKPNIVSTRERSTRADR